MEKDRGYRVVALVALLVAVVGLSVGFAAFTRDLNINFSDSNVNVSGDLDIRFLASDNTSDTTKTIEYSLNGATAAGNATIGSDGLTINGVGATFSNKGQSVEYDFYIYNDSEYDAYLKKVEFLDYTGAEVNKVCTALTGTTQSLVDDACEDISLTINIAGHDVINTKTSDFTSPKITKGDVIPVKVTINYDGGENSALLPNGDFKINFGGIKLSYSSLVSESSSGGTTTEPSDPDDGGDDGDVEMEVIPLRFGNMYIYTKDTVNSAEETVVGLGITYHRDGSVTVFDGEDTYDWALAKYKSDEIYIYDEESGQYEFDSTVSADGKYVTYEDKENGTIQIATLASEVSMINFTIDGVTYQAQEGMTWEEWTYSYHNVDWYSVVDGGKVASESGLFVCSENSALVKGSDVILNNKNYVYGD